jgi:hypothetical protein
MHGLEQQLQTAPAVLLMQTKRLFLVPMEREKTWEVGVRAGSEIEDEKPAYRGNVYDVISGFRVNHF